jgi:hypothetical protein
VPLHGGFDESKFKFDVIIFASDIWRMRRLYLLEYGWARASETRKGEVHMKKIMFMIIGTIGLVLISCGIAQKSSEGGAIAKSGLAKLGANNSAEIGDQESARRGSSANNEISQPKKGNIKDVDTVPDRESQKPVRQYDSEKLDKEVSELALKLKENPKTFRMLIRTGEDGTKIYRMIGMHVIVNPQGDEVFLPDEI